MSDQTFLPEEPIWQHLLDVLSVYEVERRAGYAAPQSDEEAELHSTLDTFAQDVLNVIHNPTRLREVLDEAKYAKPWERIEDAVLQLLTYKFIHEEAETAAVREVLQRLAGLPVRIRLAILAVALLQQSRPSDTAQKYLARVTKLYLAGFTTEVIIVCGAVLEAALRDQIPDDELHSLGWKPAYRRTGVFSVGQRMKAEAQRPFLSAAERASFWDVMNWRNDAVHVQPDTGPHPAVALAETAYLLGRIQPKG